MENKVTRYRELKKMGACSIIHLAPIDLKDFGWKVGDMIDVADCVGISKELYNLKLGKEIDNGREKVEDEEDDELKK
jgi:hypothetical protein